MIRDRDSNEAAKVAFENYVRENLQAAVSFAGGNPGIDRIWLYTILSPSSIETGVYYRYRGSFIGFGDLPYLDPDGPYEYDTSRLIDEQVSAPGKPLIDALMSTGDLPERIIVAYDPAAGTMESTWDYEGTKARPTDPGWKARDAWIESMGGEPAFR